jgi:hypothetical protein
MLIVVVAIPEYINDASAPRETTTRRIASRVAQARDIACMHFNTFFTIHEDLAQIRVIQVDLMAKCDFFGRFPTKTLYLNEKCMSLRRRSFAIQKFQSFVIQYSEIVQKNCILKKYF